MKDKIKKIEKIAANVISIAFITTALYMSITNVELNGNSLPIYAIASVLVGNHLHDTSYEEDKE